MSRLKSGALSCWLGLALLADARFARAAGEFDSGAVPFKVSVSYQAPEGCPRASTFMTLLAGHLEAGDSPPLNVHVNISHVGALYLLDLTVLAPTPRRSKEGAASCGDLVRLAALMAAVARTPHAPPEPLLPPEPPSDPHSFAKTGSESPPVDLSPDQDHSDALAAPEPDSTPFVPGPHWMLAGQVQSGLGVLPGVAFGTGPLLELAWPSFALRGAASWWLPREVAGGGGLDSLAPLSLTLQSLDVAACLKRSMYEGASHELSLSACAVVSGYRLGVEAHHLGASSDVIYRAGAGFSAGAMWALPGALQMGVQLGLSELARPLRVLAPPLRGTVYESRGSQVRFDVVVGFRFGGGAGG